MGQSTLRWGQKIKQFIPKNWHERLEKKLQLRVDWAGKIGRLETTKHSKE